MTGETGKADTGQTVAGEAGAAPPPAAKQDVVEPALPDLQTLPSAGRGHPYDAATGPGTRVVHLRVTRSHILFALLGVMILWIMVAFSLHQSGFVIHAQTEAVRILSIKSFASDGWRIDGAVICEDPPFTAEDLEPQPVCVETLPPEPFFTPADGSTITLRSLAKDRLEAVIDPAPVAEAGSGTATDRPVTLSRLRGYAGGSADITFTGTVRINWTGKNPHSPLVFLGPAQIGFAPESGNPGLTLGGSAAGYMAARAGAPRFEVSRAEIVPGDVLSARMPGRKWWLHRQVCRGLAALWIIHGESCDSAGPMHGVILFDATDDGRGFEIVYAGPAQRIMVDRLGSRFELAPDWTSRFRNDPLLLILFGAITFGISIAGLVLGQRKRGG